MNRPPARRPGPGSLGIALAFLAVTGIGRLAAQPPAAPPRGAWPPAPAARAGEDWLVDAWARMRPSDRTRLTSRFLALEQRDAGGHPDEARFDLFRAALRDAPAQEGARVRRGRMSERVRLLLELTDRYVQEALTRRMLREIPARLEGMKQAGLVTEDEIRRIDAITDLRRREKAYFELRGLSFLRQMQRAGRIDDETFARVSGLASGPEKTGALEQLRQREFLRVNAHLLHFLLKPAERLELRNARLPGTFHLCVERMERRKQAAFLSVFPSQDPNRLSHLLRMSEAQERRLNAEGLPADRREETAQEIYRQQRETFLAALAARLGPDDQDKARFVAVADDPTTFYRRASQVLQAIEGPERRLEDGGAWPPDLGQPGMRPPGGGPGGPPDSARPKPGIPGGRPDRPPVPGRVPQGPPRGGGR